MLAVHRPSWPDFLIRISAQKAIAVEVKGRGDWFSPNQARTFDILESAGIHVFIWDELKPEFLQKWENVRPHLYDAGKKRR